MATRTSSVKTTASKKASTKKGITAEAIRQRAEQIYHERINNGNHGDALSDWLQAESELKNVY